MKDTDKHSSFIRTEPADTRVVRYTRFEIRYHRNVDTRPGRGLSLGIFFTLATAVLGVIIVLFLILTIK